MAQTMLYSESSGSLLVNCLPGSVHERARLALGKRRLPTISLHFDTSMAAVQWIPLAYQLTIVGLVLSMARLGDKLGRKGVYTVGFVMLASVRRLAG